METLKIKPLQKRFVPFCGRNYDFIEVAVFFSAWVGSGEVEIYGCFGIFF